MLFLHSGNYYLVNKIIHVILAKTFFSYKIFYFMRNKKPILLALFLMSSLFSTQSFAQKKIAKVDPKAGWHKQYTDEHKGINLVAALQYMKEQGIKPKKEVVIGILDSGIDTT